MAFTFATSIFAQKKADDIAKFNTETYDFGKIKQGVPATATFVVTNIGKEPLLIEAANPTCGCTISDYTKTAIAPGQTGTIHATFNAAAVSPIHKTLTVKFAGADDIKMINLAGEVLDPAAYDTWAANNKKDVKTEVKTETKVKDDKVKTETKTEATTTKVTKKNKKSGKKVEKTVVKS